MSEDRVTHKHFLIDGEEAVKPEQFAIPAHRQVQITGSTVVRRKIIRNPRGEAISIALEFANGARIEAYTDPLLQDLDEGMVVAASAPSIS